MARTPYCLPIVPNFHYAVECMRILGEHPGYRLLTEQIRKG